LEPSGERLHAPAAAGFSHGDAAWRIMVIKTHCPPAGAVLEPEPSKVSEEVIEG
jgi:hypothetical protein